MVHLLMGSSWAYGLIVASFSSKNPTASSASSLTCRRQLTHFHLHPHLSSYDNETGKAELSVLYFILGFFEGVSSSSSLEMSSAKLIKSLLTAKIGLMAEDDSLTDSFLQTATGVSIFGTREVGVAFGAILETGFLEWLARLKGEGVFEPLMLFLTVLWFCEGSGVLSILSLFLTGLSD